MNSVNRRHRDNAEDNARCRGFRSVEDAYVKAQGGDNDALALIEDVLEDDVDLSDLREEHGALSDEEEA